MSKTIKTEITVTVDQDWIDFCTKFSDLFYTSYCGYWARGMKRDDKLGWLVFEHGDEVRNGEEPNVKRAVREWKAGNKLPSQYYRLDEAAAIRAYQHGVERGGVNWYENGDAGDYDSIIQLALLGEIRYG